MSDATPPLAAAKATQEDVIDLRELTLIGLMQAYDGPAALLRSSRGQIARVQVGTQVFGVTVTGIDAEQILLTTRFGQTEALPLVGS